MVSILMALGVLGYTYFVFAHLRFKQIFMNLENGQQYIDREL